MKAIPVFAIVACLGTAAGRGECAPAGQVAARSIAAATIAPLASLTATVAGPEWEVRTVIPPGTSPHVFEPSPRDVRRFAPARLVVTVGAGYDDWAGRLVAACASGAALHDAGLSVGVARGDGGAGVDHDGELGRDPHWWLSPRRAARALAPLAERFAALDPAGADGYRRRASAGAAALLALDAEVAALLGPVKGATVVAAHNSWAYFTSDYGLVDGGAIETAPGREPSPRDLRKLVDLVRARGVRAVFAEPQFSAAAARVLASDAGIRVAFADPIGGVPGRSDYADLLRYDAHAFRDALGAP
ncbi:MAG: metal ABC transporter substrate-binding protein [Acidobacteriota bacterium]|nr:metal ABC transporter substrate-binding protein [Acidobacteriota bacterium]